MEVSITIILAISTLEVGPVVDSQLKHASFVLSTAAGVVLAMMQASFEVGQHWHALTSVF